LFPWRASPLSLRRIRLYFMSVVNEQNPANIKEAAD
jgi:hypothetical protein